MDYYSNVHGNVSCQNQNSADIAGDHLKKSSAGTANACLVLSYIGLVAWLLPIAGFAVTILSLMLGKSSLNSVDIEKARKGIRLAAIGLMLTIANSLAGVILGVLGVI